VRELQEWTYLAKYKGLLDRGACFGRKVVHDRNGTIEVRVEEEGGRVSLLGQVDGAVGSRFEDPVSAIAISMGLDSPGELTFYQ
jgi:hypothetical protein